VDIGSRNENASKQEFRARSDSIGTEKAAMHALHGSFAPTKKVGALMLLPRSARSALPDSTVVQGSA
jgi:hypothetical protein